MNHSEMGDLQDAIALSGMVPQSCVPTFDELESWSPETVADVRRWLAEGYWSDRTPDVFITKIKEYNSPDRPVGDVAYYVRCRVDRMEDDEDHAVTTLGRDVGFTLAGYRW